MVFLRMVPLISLLAAQAALLRAALARLSLPESGQKQRFHVCRSRESNILGPLFWFFSEAPNQLYS